MFLDSAPSGEPVSDVSSLDMWVEVVGPIVEALHVLAQAIQATHGSLAGASIAVTERGTILLNQRAWILLAPTLKTVPSLVTRHSSREESKPIRFLLVASGDASATEPA